MTELIERPLSPNESAVVSWLVQNAPMRGSLAHLLPLVASLRVVDACGCGCPGVDFVKDGQASPRRPIADAGGVSPEGIEVGLILWGGPNEIAGLEVYSQGEEPIFGLPDVQKLKIWEKP